MSGPEYWRVKSGSLDVEVAGATPLEAFLNAVKQYNPKTLGVIAEVTSEPVYVHTERALREAGLWGEAAPAAPLGEESVSGDLPREGKTPK